ncbi:MAG: M48 family metallopeptidase [Fulvimarina manganoxydans]|uniref:M48 family metallopeptidase n=1 Tax=Fulvimarina manganoxydans TaxID=937218 RepID=UPI002354844D|nr:SprT family zinc-dependent metalloprotease [Fulvimarina manganoxydans]MCK5932873.1 M48 family metallopeptidase [Fulvimarina manganoxydans]
MAIAFRKTTSTKRPRTGLSGAEPVQSIHVAGRDLLVTVRRNRQARRLILRLAPEGDGVLVTAPPRAGTRQIAEFLERHRSWIEDRLDDAPRPIDIIDGAILPFRGAPLRIVHHGGRLRTKLSPAPLGIDAEPDDPRLVALFAEPARTGAAQALSELHVGGAPEHLARRVADFLKAEAKSALMVAVDRHAQTVGLKPAAMTLKDTKSRWGSCTSDRRLSFSWRIAMAPPDILDYLAAHEVAHFVEMNHSAAFWALCRKLCPGSEAGRAWLRTHGAVLQAVRVGSR